MQKNLVRIPSFTKIMDIKENELRFRAYDATGELYDEFLIHKQVGKPNLLVEK